jgi:hypothetical protein
VQPGAPHEMIKASNRALMQKLSHHPDFDGYMGNAAIINEAFSSAVRC